MRSVCGFSSRRRRPVGLMPGFRGKPAVGRARLELATNALKGRCSTIELPTRWPKGALQVRHAAA